MTHPRVLGPRRRGRAVAPEMLERIGFTDHAITRFADRAGLLTSERRIVEPALRALLLREGRVVRSRPRWAGSRNTAELYLQIGEWMLLIGRHDGRRPGCYVIVTAIGRARRCTWKKAIRRGHIQTPPPGAITSGWAPRILTATRVLAIRDRLRRPRRVGS
jgi:hypothetical protein